MNGKTKVITCGCRFNRFESAEIESRLPKGGGKNIVVINSCAVTKSSEAKSRRAVRRAVRENPSASIVVAGCWPELDPEAVKSMEGVSLVLGNEEKFRVNDRLESSENVFTGEVQNAELFKEIETGKMPDRTAAYLKIQNGCDETCSFCVVRLVRGKSRSASMEFVLSRVDDLIAGGAREIVLTGINVGAYGNDLNEDGSLAALLAQLSSKDGARFRMSSINPNEIDNETISVIADSSNICRHLHIPMQSGSDAVLKKMKRPYSAAQYRKKIEEIAIRMPGIALGCDLMTGFPGETEEDFRGTMEMLLNLPFSYSHVFTYSPRDKTSAFVMADELPMQVKKERAQRLKTVAEDKNLEYRKSLVGSTLKVLVEKRENSGTLLKGKSDNFVDVEFRGDPRLKGELVNVAITGLTENCVTGATGEAA
ncbi:MAG: tRNA (N(6)-L-threonylcarbamoyladenosine(37)-C(2))-methylthiotransferase MtaB [Nitrospinota bacterium]